MFHRLSQVLSRHQLRDLSQVLSRHQLSFHATRSLSMSRPLNAVLLTSDPQSQIATLTLNRPPVNSLNSALMSEIIRTVDQLETNGYAAVVVKSSSPNVFCSGLDFAELRNPSEQNLREFWRLLQEMFRRLYSLKIPNVTLINGYSPAGGTILALCSDYRLMRNNPKFTIGLNEPMFGLSIPFWLIDAYACCIGHRNAELYAQMAHLFSPEEAKNVGLVDRLFDTDEEGEAICSQVLQRLTKTVDPFARNVVKKELRQNLLRRLKTEAQRDIDFSTKVIMSKKFQENLENYLEALSKRKK